MPRFRVFPGWTMSILFGFGAGGISDWFSGSKRDEHPTRGPGLAKGEAIIDPLARHALTIF